MYFKHYVIIRDYDVDDIMREKRFVYKNATVSLQRHSLSAFRHVLRLRRRNKCPTSF